MSWMTDESGFVSLQEQGTFPFQTGCVWGLPRFLPSRNWGYNGWGAKLATRLHSPVRVHGLLHNEAPLS
jgi:hypothetical protein